jgi:hypothetical protein
VKFRVAEGQTVQKGVATYSEGEEFEATGDEAQAWLSDGRVERVDKK